LEKYDVIIIGSGSGGLTVAYTAKGFGKKILLIDKEKPGGECTWSGCVPSKSLIHLAKEIAIVRKYQPDYKVDYEAVLKNVRETRENVYLSETPEMLQKDGITFIHGSAQFVSRHEVKVNDVIYSAPKIFIATGSSPFIPPIKGLSDIIFETNTTLFEPNRLKDSMIILGGGAIGVEIAMALNDLGINVSLIEMASRLLIREEPELSLRLQKIMVEKGINVYLNAKVVEVRKSTDLIQVAMDVQSEENHLPKTTTLEAKSLFVAVGRVPNIEGLCLEKAGIAYSPKGIIVDCYLATTNKRIFAIGDVASKYQFSHMAFFEGVQAVKNSLLPIKTKMSYSHVPWCTFTSPELARTGYTEEEARLKYGNTLRTYTHLYSQIDRGKTDNATDGIIKLVISSKGKLLGASILGERAGELISELQVIKTLGLNVGKLGKVIHPYPTYAEALSKLGRIITIDLLLSNPLIKLFRK